MNRISPRQRGRHVPAEVRRMVFERDRGCCSYVDALGERGGEHTEANLTLRCAEAAQVWDALRDFHAVHERVAPGFVTRCEPEAGARLLTFANGFVAREVLVGIDDSARRIAYSVVGGRASHHSASAQVFDAGEGNTRFVWITDVLPDEYAAPIAAMMDQGVLVMQKELAVRR